MEKQVLYKKLASTIQAYQTCKETDAGGVMRNPQWFHKHFESIKQLVSDFLPSGSGWDRGTKIDLDNSHADKLVFCGNFHHMDENGFYDGWTYHTITVTPSLVFDFHIRVSGRNRNEIKDYLAELFESALHTEITWDADSSTWKEIRQ